MVPALQDADDDLDSFRPAFVGRFRIWPGRPVPISTSCLLHSTSCSGIVPRPQ